MTSASAPRRAATPSPRASAREPGPAAAGPGTPRPALPTQEIKQDGGQTSASARERHEQARAPSPVTGAAGPAILPAAPARGRAPVAAVPDEKAPGGPAAVTGPEAPAGGGRAGAPPPAGSTPLAGAEWRKAAKAEMSRQAKGRRRKPATSPAGGTRAVPPPGRMPAGPAASGTGLTAAAHCGSCGWTAGPGPAGEVDRAAEKHVSPGHATATVAGLRGVT